MTTEEIGTSPVFVAVKEMFPAPFAARPILGLEFIQLKTVPTTDVVKLTAAGKPSHTVMSDGSATSGCGLTTIVNCCATPSQVIPLLVN